MSPIYQNILLPRNNKYQMRIHENININKISEPEFKNTKLKTSLPLIWLTS